MIRTNLLLAGDDGGYNLTKSLRFRSSASAYLNRTFSTPTLSTKWTWSGWIKFGYASTYYTIFDGGSPDTRFGRDPSTNQLYVSNDTTNFIITTPVYRDYSSWYHAVLAFDSSQGTASNRLRLYINGSEVTAFATDNRSSISGAIGINTATAHGIGRQPSGGSAYFDGYLTEVNFIDGQQLTPSSFGSTNALTGVWQPAKYTGTYGTNGFYLPFTNTTSTTTLGYDFSGNSNNWTTNNLSLTTGSTYDSMNDVPTLTSATTANYATLNPLDYSSSGTITIANGNLQTSASGGSYGFYRATMQMATKTYWEQINTMANSGDGIYAGVGLSTGTVSGTGICYYTGNGQIYLNGSVNTTVASYTTNDVIGMAYDPATGNITFYKNNTSQATIATGFGSSAFPICGDGSSNTETCNINFGQQPFTYTPPTGFVALNTYNLPTSTIVKGNTVMDATTYTGNATTNNITSLGFQPDFSWFKVRSEAGTQIVHDVLRGTGGVNRLFPNTTSAESTNGDGFVTFTSNGFNLDGGGGGGDVNGMTGGVGRTYVAWNWKANGAGSSNTSGSITSTVSVNASAGFSVVTYTGTGANATVGHGLGVAPSMIIAKNRSSSTNWEVYHSALGNGYYGYLNATNAFSTAGASTVWNTAPTSSVFGIGTSGDVNTNGSAYVAYCWSEIAGFSKFGSYTGNGSSDGPFVYTGFRPKLVIWKCSSSDQGGNAQWGMIDTSRNAYNVSNSRLNANSSNSEDSNPWLDILSNGFKVRETSTAINNSGSTYIYMAFAENPLKYALAR